MRSLVGMLAESRALGTMKRRAVAFGALFLLCMALALFPQRYLAGASLTPTDPESLGLSGTLGQLGAINNVFGDQAAIEIALRVGRSVAVRDLVIDRQGLLGRIDVGNRVQLHRWLDSHVTVRSLRGGIILISLQHRDPALARDVVSAYTLAIRDELAAISRRQTAYKRRILLDLVSEATDRLGKAQAAFDSFRLSTRAALPEVRAATLSGQIAGLEGLLKARRVELEVARQTFTDDHVEVRRLRAEIASLGSQLSDMRATGGQRDSSVGQVVGESRELYRRERELAVAKALYESYLRYLQGTAVEDMTSTAAVRVLEEPHVETARQFWWPALAAGIGVLLLWIAMEAYVLRPPIGARLRQRNDSVAASSVPAGV